MSIRSYSAQVTLFKTAQHIVASMPAWPICEYCGFAMPYQCRKTRALPFAKRPPRCYCRKTYYCDRTCQRRHWRVHKLSCPMYAFAMTSQGSRLENNLLERQISPFLGLYNRPKHEVPTGSAFGLRTCGVSVDTRAPRKSLKFA